MAAAGLTPDDLATPQGLLALPLLTRAQLQIPAVEVDCAVLPRGHGATHTATSSGSTGEPVTVRKTAIGGMLWQSQTLRWHGWSGGTAIPD